MNRYLRRKISAKLMDSRFRLVRELYSRLRRMRGKVRKAVRMQSVRCGNATFISIRDLTESTVAWAACLPERYDLVVGIPRAGLLVANVLGIKLGLPTTSPFLLMQNRLLDGAEITDAQTLHSVLLVDDSIGSGKTIERELRVVQDALPKARITTGSVIVQPDNRRMVDLFYRVVRPPQINEWGLMDNKKVNRIAWDMDGVICEECPPQASVSEEKYRQWLQTARPLHIPNYEIDYIISNRIEKYRPETEEWLARHGVRYGRLLLWDVPSWECRRGRFAERKAELVKQVRPDIFFESSLTEAEMIWHLTGVPTLCFEQNILLGSRAHGKPFKNQLAQDDTDT